MKKRWTGVLMVAEMLRLLLLTALGPTGPALRVRVRTIGTKLRLRQVSSIRYSGNTCG